MIAKSSLSICFLYSSTSYNFCQWNWMPPTIRPKDLSLEKKNHFRKPFCSVSFFHQNYQYKMYRNMSLLCCQQKLSQFVRQSFDARKVLKEPKFVYTVDSGTRNLMSVSKISDYMLSNELVSMALAMVAKDKQINRVLKELVAEEEQREEN